MSGPNIARVSELDPVAASVENAPDDERQATIAELDALSEARAGTEPFVSGAAVTAMITERSQRAE